METSLHRCKIQNLQSRMWRQVSIAVKCKISNLESGDKSQLLRNAKSPNLASGDKSPSLRNAKSPTSQVETSLHHCKIQILQPRMWRQVSIAAKCKISNLACGDKSPLAAKCKILQSRMWRQVSIAAKFKSPLL